MQHGHVFYDPTGRRRRLLRRFGSVAAVVVAGCTTAFVISLLIIPLVPRIPGLQGGARRELRPAIPHLTSRRTRLVHYLARESRSELEAEIVRARRRERRGPATLRPGAPIVAGFYTIWRSTGLQSLRSNADCMTDLMPEWLHLDSLGSALDTTDWNPRVTPHNLDVIRIAREHGLRIEPILNNAVGGGFDALRLGRLLASPQRQRAASAAVRDWIVRNGFQGVNLDFENLVPSDSRRYEVFVAQLARTLHARGLILSVDLEASTPAPRVAALARSADFVVLMAYGEHSTNTPPGPIASAPWYYDLLQRTLRAVPPAKLVVGIGNYAFDWSEATPAPPAATLTYQSALMTARDFAPDSLAPERMVDFDADALNPTFDYVADDGSPHEVWMLNGPTAYNQWLLARRARARGAALWVLGAEDPSVWTFLDHRRLGALPSAAALERVQFPYEIEFSGTGEILSVASRPQAGQRNVDVDPRTGLVTDVAYQRFPSSFVIRRSGFRPSRIAITLDDGPDARYTPQILDVLEELHVPATFFIVGENAQRYPDLVRRMWRDGDEIGNHTFFHPNLAAVSRRRELLEINTTQRVLEGITGHSTILFRAPYNADAEPTTGDEVQPLLVAAQLGYVTVGEVIDPEDWNLKMLGPAGDSVPRTVQDLEESILRGIEHHKADGNVLLLHNAGGDRALTVAALRTLVPELRQQGYRFVSVSDLLGATRDAVMPPVGRSDVALVGFDRVAFSVIYTLENLLTLCFILGVTLGLARVLLMAPIALAAARRSRRRNRDADYRPAVSVLVAAYNERDVIAHTVESILASDYPDLEVIVVDDGSSDGTAGVVEGRWAGNAAVRVLRQDNAGKAVALNHALDTARGQILICFDADTQIASDTVRLLVARFADPRIGAVAGNVKVGNRVNVLTRWQSIEYITSQNLDRRVYALLNAVTVVPGAVGGWRREAVEQVGGYVSDTMAEDMDLTFRIRRAGWRIETENDAVGFTEAPDGLRALLRQRFRWAFGTLQCLWKHRDALFHYGWFGWLALPGLWVFQIVFQVLAPLVDLQMLYALCSFLSSWLERAAFNQDWQPLPHAVHLLATTGFFYALFFATELLVAVIAFRLDRERLRTLVWLFWQRLFYRQVMYVVLWKALGNAARGARTGWAKLERKGSVRIPEQAGA